MVSNLVPIRACHNAKSGFFAARRLMGASASLSGSRPPLAQKDAGGALSWREAVILNGAAARGLRPSTWRWIVAPPRSEESALVQS
jgi:hypothetical protein